MKFSLKRRLHHQDTKKSTKSNNDPAGPPVHNVKTLELQRQQEQHQQPTMDTRATTPTIAMESSLDHNPTSYFDSTTTKDRRNIRDRTGRIPGEFQWSSLRPQKIKKWVGGKAVSITRLKPKRWDVHDFDDGAEIQKDEVSCGDGRRRRRRQTTKNGECRNREKERRQQESFSTSSSNEVHHISSNAKDKTDDTSHGKLRRRRWWMKSPSSTSSVSFPRRLSRSSPSSSFSSRSRSHRGSKKKDVFRNRDGSVGDEREVGIGDNRAGNTSVEQTHASSDDEDDNDRTMSTTTSSSSGNIANDNQTDMVLGPLFPSSFVDESDPNSHQRQQEQHNDNNCFRDQIRTRDVAADADDSFEDSDDWKYLMLFEKELNNIETSSPLPPNKKVVLPKDVTRPPDQLVPDNQNTDARKKHSKLADDTNGNVQSGSANNHEIDKEGHEKPFQFDKSEIISLLFPLGYPSARTTTDSKMDTSSECKKVITPTVTELLNSEHRNDRHVGNLALQNGRTETSCSLDGTVESLLRDEMTLDSSTDTSKGKRMSHNSSDHTRKGNRRASNTDPSKDRVHTHARKKKKGPHHGVSSADVIGREISFDPTWDLLQAEQDNVSVLPTRRSKLQKLQKIEQYSDSLLEKYTNHEEGGTSIEISDVFDEGPSAKMLLDLVDRHDETISLHSDQKLIGDTAFLSTAFELGWHFDPVVFPEINAGPDEEFEICFESDLKSYCTNATPSVTWNIVLTNTNGCDEKNLEKANKVEVFQDIESTNSVRCFSRRELVETEHESTKALGTPRSCQELDADNKELVQPRSQIDQCPIDLPVEWLMPLSPINSDAGSALSALDLSLPLPSLPSEPALDNEENVTTSLDRAGRDVFDIIDDDSDGVPSCYRSTDSDECFY